MTRVSSKRRVSLVMAVLMASATMFIAAPAAMAGHGCEEFAPGGEVDYELDGTAFVIEGKIGSAIVLRCHFEGEVGDYIRYEATTNICVPIHGEIDAEGTVDPDGSWLTVRIKLPRLTTGSVQDFMVVCGEGLQGRMTGGGWTGFAPDKVTMGSTLPCSLDDDPSQDQNLQVNWAGNTFHLEEPETSVCLGHDDYYGGGEHKGQGTGRCNGEPAEVEWSVEDGGSYTSWWDGSTYNFPDYVELEIDGPGGCQLDIEQELYGGQLTLHVTG